MLQHLIVIKQLINFTISEESSSLSSQMTKKSLDTPDLCERETPNLLQLSIVKKFYLEVKYIS